jgi:hypothetical protein
MGCGCKNKNELTGDASGLVQSWPNPNEVGMVELASAPDCDKLYSGPFRQATLLVVGLGTEQETLFVRGMREAAITLAKAESLTIDPVPARSICHDAAVAVLGY